MLLFGLTGGIGTGKSQVSRCLQDRGIPVLAADPVARQLMMTVPEIRDRLTELFGHEVYTADGSIDKDKLRELVFSDQEARTQINAIVHPHVISFIKEEAGRLHDEGQHDIIGVEAALIYESGMAEMLDVVVVVDAPLEMRRRWLAARDHLGDEEIAQRINAQMPMSEKKKRADFVVENNGSLQKLQEKVLDLHRWLQSLQPS